MTKIHHQSPDRIVQILITDDDHRYPRHGAPMAVVKLQPRDHTRCRRQWGGITIMFTHEEIRGLLEAIQKCDAKFRFSIPKLRNKPKSQVDVWSCHHRERIKAKRRPGGWIP
jgi:hypothetical protein